MSLRKGKAQFKLTSRRYLNAHFFYCIECLILIMIPSPNSAYKICIVLMLYISYVYHVFHVFRLQGICVCVWLAAITCGVDMCGIHVLIMEHCNGLEPLYV